VKAASLENIIGSAAGAGWEWFDQAPDAVRDKIKLDRDLDAEDGKAIARAWADFYRTPGGRKALERMFDATLRRTVFFATLGVDFQSMAAFGAFREGQNALAHEIARQIGLGLQEDVKPRD
jgi:hypothetical protein